MANYMRRGYQDRRPLVSTFFQVGPDPASEATNAKPPRSSFVRQIRAGLLGVTFPWTLAATAALGVWLMFSTMVFGTSGDLADSATSSER